MGLVETRELFAARTARWDERFPGDEPAFARAVTEIGPAEGDAVIDLGWGTGPRSP